MIIWNSLDLSSCPAFTNSFAVVLTCQTNLPVACKKQYHCSHASYGSWLKFVPIFLGAPCYKKLEISMVQIRLLTSCFVCNLFRSFLHWWLLRVPVSLLGASWTTWGGRWRWRTSRTRGGLSMCCLLLAGYFMNIFMCVHATCQSL